MSLLPKYFSSPSSIELAEQFFEEIALLISKTNETPLEPFDIISDNRSVTALCLLYSSMVRSFNSLMIRLVLTRNSNGSPHA